MLKTGFKKLLADLLLLTPFVLFLFFRLDGIFNDMSNSDAARWHRRSEKFASAIKSQDFAQTYTSYHPGVTLMWITSGVELGLKTYAHFTNAEFKTLENTDGYILIDGVSKIALVVVLFALLILQFKYIDALFDRDVAFFYAFLAAIEPYYVGINRWYHLTSLEISLSFTAFLSLLMWSQFKQKSSLVKSALLYGLAILTKFSSLILVPVFALVFLITALKDRVLNKMFYLKASSTFVLATVIAIAIFFPALWVTPIEVISKLVSAGSNAADGYYYSVWFGEKRPLLFYLTALLFKLSPITLVLFVYGLLKAFFWRERLVTYNVVYILVAFSLLTFSEQKIERYILTFLPSILLLCAVVLSRVGSTFRTIAFICIFTFSLLIFTNYHPLYSAYYSPVLGGPKQAYTLGLYDDNGEYFYRAAQYLNLKGRDVVVYVPFNVESFSYYYKGKLVDSLEPGTNYVVMSNDSRRPFMDAKNSYKACQDLEKVFYNYNLPVVEIYKCGEIIPDTSTPFD